MALATARRTRRRARRLPARPRLYEVRCAKEMSSSPARARPRSRRRCVHGLVQTCSMLCESCREIKWSSEEAHTDANRLPSMASPLEVESSWSISTRARSKVLRTGALTFVLALESTCVRKGQACKISAAMKRTSKRPRARATMRSISWTIERSILCRTSFASTADTPLSSRRESREMLS